MSKIAFTISLIVCLIIAGVGGLLGGQALVPPQTTTLTETLTVTPPITKTSIRTETKTPTSKITVVTASYAGPTITGTLTPLPTTFITVTKTVTPVKGCEIRILNDKDYYRSLINDLKNAKEKILVAMYSMIYDPDDPFDWANDLIRELVKAEERGVNVEVILEYRTHNGYMDENLEAYHYLREHGVDVRLDRDKDTDHMKLVVIDGEIIYVGSHNWTEAALYYNHETSIRIVDSQAAKILETYFKTI